MRTMQPTLEELSELNQMIVVCPEGGINSWWIDSPIVDTSQFESYIIRDVVPTIDNSYSTISDRKGRFITGVSMGGHGAFYIAIRNSKMFSSCGSMIGGMDLTYEPNKFGIATLLGPYQDNKTLWESHSVVNLVEQLEPGELHLIFDSSLEDFFYPGNVSLHNKLNALQIEHKFVTLYGQHNIWYARTALPVHFIFFRNTLHS